jgi:hypothetical protein
MAKMYEIPYHHGSHPSFPLDGTEEKFVVYYTIIFREYSTTTLVGNIGKTACCGSSDVMGLPSLSGEILLELIRLTRTACYRIHYYKSMYDNLTDGLNFVNTRLKGVAKVEEIPELSCYGQIWLSVDVQDTEKMKEFYGNH